MRTETVNGVELTHADIVAWQEPETNVWHEGFITPYGHPFAGFTYMVVSQTAGLMRLEELKAKANVRKKGELC